MKETVEIINKVTFPTKMKIRHRCRGRDVGLVNALLECFGDVQIMMLNRKRLYVSSWVRDYVVIPRLYRTASNLDISTYCQECKILS